MVFCFLPGFLFCQFFSEYGFYIWVFSAVMFFVRCGQCIFVRVRYCQRAAGAESLFKIPPPLQGEARSGRVPTQNASAFCVGPGGGSGRGWRDVVHESKFRFFQSFAALTPALSLASQAMLVAARAVPVPQGEGAYWLFFRFSVSYTSIRKNAVLQDFEQALNLLPNGCHGAAARKRSTVAAMSFAWVMAEMTAMPSAPAR